MAWRDQLTLSLFDETSLLGLTAEAPCPAASPPPACSGHSGTSHPSWPLSVRLRSREPDTQSTFVS